MAEMADLASALDKLEVTKKPEEEKASPPAEQSKKSEESPPASSDKPAEEASPPASSDKPAEESSPPASSDKPEEKQSPPPDREEVTHKLGSSKAEDSSPPESKQPNDPADDDLLEFTSATEGEASSSAWELAPDKKIARKKGVKSDSEIDSLLKKVIKEAEGPEKVQVTPKDLTSSGAASSTPAKDVAVIAIPEEPADEAAAEAEANKEEALAAEKAVTSNWEADFSLEDAPTPPSKDVLTTGMGRKNPLTPAHHPSEQGLPWNAHLEQLAREPDVELTAWGWEQFFAKVLEGNSDVLCFLIHPFPTLSEYVNSRKAWHNKAIVSPGAKEAKHHLVDVEQHAFMLILLKVLVREGGLNAYAVNSD